MADGEIAASTCLEMREITDELKNVTAAKWHPLGINLGLKQAKLSEIEANYPHNTQRCKCEVINWWLDNAQPTEKNWETLAQALEAIDESTTAQNLRRKTPVPKEHATCLLSTSGNSEIKTHQKSVTCNGAAMDLDENASQTDACNGHRNLYEKIKADPPFTKQYQGNVKDEDELMEETYKIRCKFLALFVKVRNFLVSRGVTVKEFVSFLEDIPGYERESLLNVKVVSKLYEKLDLIDVFKTLKCYCSWFNHSLLGLIIDIYCGDEIKSEHQDYYASLQKYCKHRAKDCPLRNGFGHGSDEDIKMIVKVDRKWEEIRIEDLKEVIFTLARIIKVSRHTLRLCCVDKGCVQLTLLVPSNIPDAVFPLTSEQEAAILKMKVSAIQCGTHNLSSQDSQASTVGDSVEKDHQAFDTESDLLQMCTDGNLPVLKDHITKQGLNPNGVKDPSGVTLLHIGCQNGHLDIVQYLIEHHKCNPETTTPNGHTPLHLACKSGHLHIVKCLITDHKCNPHCTDNDGYTPLHAASESGNIETVKYLITEQGCDPQVSDSIDNTPLHYASKSGHLDIVKCLITEFNCHPQKLNSRGSTPLHFACKGGQIAVARYLIKEHQCNPNYTNMFGNTSLHFACCLPLVKYLIDEHACNPQIVNNYGLTSLHFACLNGHLDTTKYLISDCNCNPQCSANNGNTPLHCACQNGHLEVAKYLITEHKCSPEHGNVDGYTPLHSAASNGHLAVVKYLISELGCNPQITDNDGSTPLHWACENGHLDFANYFITEHKCDPNYLKSRVFTPLYSTCKKERLELAKHLVTENNCSVDCCGYSTLHSAASNDHLAVVKYLISELGCDPQITDKNGNTPLHYACLNGHLDITKYLISDCNCNSQCSTNYGSTPVHFACQNGHLEVAKYLINEQNCNPEQGNINGYTPLHSAASNGHLVVVKYLITQHNCNSQCSDTNGFTPLHQACYSGHLHVVKYLIHERNCACETEAKLPANMIKDKLGFPPHTLLEKFEPMLNTDGITPLHAACESGHIDIVKYLIDVCKCNPNHPTSNGLTAIDVAQILEHKEIVSYFKNECKYSCKFDLMLTGHDSHHDGTSQMLTKTISHLLNDPSFSLNDLYFTPLELACITGNFAAVKFFTTAFNYSPSVGSLGLTPLHTACMMGHLEIAMYLVTECKCDTKNVIGTTSHQQTSLMHTPLSTASAIRHLEVIRWLVGRQKSTSECNENSVSFVYLTCILGLLSGIKYLLSKCCQDFPDLLFVACCFGHLNIVRYLIYECACNPHSVTTTGITPLHLACIGIQHLSKNSSEDSTFESGMSTTSKNKHQPSENITTSNLGIKGILLHIWHAIIFPVTMVTQLLTNFVPGFPNPTKQMKNYDILSDAMWANCESRSGEETTTPNLDVVKYLIDEHNCNPQCRDKEGQTPLHYACASGQLEIVRYFHSEKLSDLIHTSHSGDTPLHFACKYNQVEVVQFLLSTGECDPLIKNIEGLSPVEIATSPEIRKLLDHFCKGKYPLELVVKVFVLGDPMAGKSSLVQAIQSKLGFLGSLLGRFQKVKGVRQQTAGIDSFKFSSSEFGNIIIYDFAGQREFHTSHAAFLQNYSTHMTGIFIIVVNITLCEDDICQSLQYWMSFVQDCCTHNEMKSHVIVVGSHADQLGDMDVDQALTVIGQTGLFEHSDDTEPSNELVAIVCLDCTRSFSPALDLLRSYLKQSCDSVRESTEKIDQRCYVLHRYVLKMCTVTDVQGHTLGKISKDLEDNPYLLPSTSTELLPLFQTLHDKGQILLLKNKYILDDSWVITNIAALLETVVGSIFAPRDFPQHIAPGSTGIVPKSRISEAFPDLNTDMIIGFLEHFEFCHRADRVRVVQSKHETSDDEYYLFPALVTVEDNILSEVLQTACESHYCCGWLIHSTAKHHFFTARFLHVLLLRLGFHFAPPQDSAISTGSEDKSPDLKTSCKILKNGIICHDRHGISTYFEVTNLNSVFLVMSCMKGSEIYCVRLRAQLINAILKARKELCPRVHVEECIMEVGNNRLVNTMEKCPVQCNTYSLKYISDCIMTRDANQDGSPGKQIFELLYFEPYTLLTSDLITQMFKKENSKLLLSETFISELAGCFYPYNNILEQIFMPQPWLLREKLKMDVYSLDSLDEMSQQLRCIHILEAWMEQQESPATYRRLRQELNKYSIFCGRNPLDLYDESSDSSEDEQEDLNTEDVLSYEDEADRPTLIECVRFQGRERRINITQEIGIKYHEFGFFLLEDDTGTKIQSIAHKHMNASEQINTEVLRQWIMGRGKHPVTWKTLTQVLHDIELSRLAGEIEDVKCHGEETIGDVPVQRDHVILTAETTEDSEQRSIRADLPSCKDSKENGLDRNFDGEILSIDCEDSGENQRAIIIPHGTGRRTDTRPSPLIQDEELDQ